LINSKIVNLAQKSTGSSNTGNAGNNDITPPMDIETAQKRFDQLDKKQLPSLAWSFSGSNVSKSPSTIIDVEPTCPAVIAPTFLKTSVRATLFSKIETAQKRFDQLDKKQLPSLENVAEKHKLRKIINQEDIIND
jgi:hypothetical protein